MTSAARVLDVLRERGLTLAIAEGDTGGLALERLTGVPGSSAVVLGGVVAYHDVLKQSVLGVPADLFVEHGAVSEPVVEAMAVGARRVCGADIGAAASGIAGPGGATPTKPVGLAWLAATDGQHALTRQHMWTGDRAANRAASVEALFDLILELVQMR